MSISSVGQGPVAPTNTTTQQVPGDKVQPSQAANNYSQSADTSKLAGTQPLNSSGRGQIVNLIV
jgi:hypothetical protein